MDCDEWVDAGRDTGRHLLLLETPRMKAHRAALVFRLS